MDLIGESPILSLADQEFRIYSKNTARPPQYVGAGAKVDNSLISEGCRIYGTVINSVVSGGVIVEEGAIIKDSVVMEDVIVKKDARIYTAIVDSDTVVEAGAVVGVENAPKSEIALIASGSVISK
jgi:glucose-1-phosphate adenylyltransferase